MSYSSSTNKELFKKYYLAIKAFEDRIKINSNKVKKGNLIKLSDYETLKKEIGYDKFSKQKSSAPAPIKDSEKISKFKFKDLEIESLSYLNNLILNDNSYILIDNTFWKVVNEKEKDTGTVFNYNTELNSLIFSFPGKKELRFKKDKNNIIKKDLLETKKDTGFDIIMKIYDSMQKFFNFEKELASSTKLGSEEKGYLVDKEWFDSWIKDANYEKIKNEYISKNIEEKEIKNKLIYQYEKKEVKYRDLSDAKKLELNSKEKIEEYLKSKALALLDENFVSCLKKNQPICEIKYKLLEKGIEIIFDTKDNLICGLKGNIITQNSETDEDEKNLTTHDVVTENNNNSNRLNNDKINNLESDIISILLSMFFQEKEFLEKVEESKNKFNNSVKDYSLINSDVYNEFKKFFSFDEEVKKIIEKFKINSISDINQTLLDKIIKESKLLPISKKIDFSKKFTLNKFFEIESKPHYDFTYGKSYINPEKVQFVEIELANKFKALFGENETINIEEISLGFNLGNIVFRPTKGKFYDKDKNYAYIFSLSKESDGIIKFIPEVIITFNTEDAMINHFLKLLGDSNLIDSCINNITHINKFYRCKVMLINKTNSNLFTKSSGDSIKVNTLVNQNQDEVNIDKCISISIKLSEEYSKFKKLINEQKYNKENECYLIKKNFIDSIEDIFNFQEIEKIMNKNSQLLQKCKNEKEKIDKIKNEISPDLKNDLKYLDDKSIELKIKSKEIFDFNLSKSFMGDKGKKAFYYGECTLISNEIYEIIEDNIKLYIDKIKSVKCIFDKGEIIILIKDGNDESINIGNLEKENNLKIKYVIEKEPGSSKLSDIFSNFKQSGIDLIKKNIPSGSQTNKESILISFSNQNNNTNTNKITTQKENNKKNLYASQRNTSSNSNTINSSQNKNVNNKQCLNKSISASSAKNYSSQSNSNPSVTRPENDTKSEVKIDDKFKSLILLSISQKKDYSTSSSSYNSSYSTTKGHKVYLINKDLEKFKFSEINNLLEESSSKITSLITTLNKSTSPVSTSKEITEIAQKLNQELLKKLNEDIITISKTTFSFQWEPKSENIKLLKSKAIKAYKEFIISPESTFNELKINFNIINIEPVNYIHITTGDIIYKDNILFYGKLNKTTNTYDIKYIFEFDSETHLTTELIEITRGVDSYIRNKTALVESNIDDKISPIFTTYKTIGNIYKYSYLCDDYSKCFDYSKYLKNEKLSKFISLYNFYDLAGKKLDKSYSSLPEKYYLIKSSAIMQIKNNCEYDQMKQILDTKFNLELGDLGLTTDDKKMLKIIKNIPKDILERNFSTNNTVRKIPKTGIEPEVKYIVNQNNPNEIAIIYDNFGIIDKKVAEGFIEGISSLYSFSNTDKNAMDCTLVNGRIIIEYKTSLENSKYVGVIGSVDPNNFLIFNEYALIYKDFSGFSSHIITLKSKLNNFLQELQLFNGTQPITDKEFKELGTLIQINQTQNPIIPKPTPIIPTPNPIIPKPKPKPLPPKPVVPINDDYNLNSNLNISSIRQYFTYPPLIGLENIGATCYMNATLQCFCNIEKFVDYFKYNKHLIDIVRNDYYKKKLCSSFKLLTEKLWPDNFMQKRSTYYPPHDFKNNISSKNPLFQGVAANDSKDLVNFLIMTLHEELNKAKNFNNMNVSSSFADQRNQQVMLNNFIQNFQATNKSIISDLFYAVNCNIIQCSLCNAQTFNYQTYFFIIFPLEEVRKFKLSNSFNQFNNFNNMINNNEVNIYDCFEYDKKITYMSGENAMHCNYCQRTCNSSMCTLLTTGPEILILILNRGKGIEFNVKINFVERLNLANYIQFSNTGVNYELIGVITHMGESSLSGHFIAICKSPISKTWFRYNDATVSPVGNFKSEVIDYAMPYLLFYQKMH